MTKTYIELQEEVSDIGPENLNEFRILRAAAVLGYARQAKTKGDEAKRHMISAKTEFQKAGREENIEDKINHMLDGMEELADGVIDIRMMLGSLTALNVSSAVLAERTNRQIMQLIRQAQKRK